MNKLMMAVRNGTMSAEQAAEQGLRENAYATLYAECDAAREGLQLEWNNGMVSGPDADEYRARRDAHYAIQEAAKKIDLQRKSAQPVSSPVMVRCSCGHTVPKIQVMNASNGTSCPDCYDRMSE